MHQYHFSRLSLQRTFLLQQRQQRRQQQRALLCVILVPSRCTFSHHNDHHHQSLLLLGHHQPRRHTHTNNLNASSSSSSSSTVIPDPDGTIQKMTRRSIQQNAAAAPLRKKNDKNNNKEHHQPEQGVRIWQKDRDSFEKQDDINDHVIAVEALQKSSSCNDATRRLAAQCLPHWLSRSRDRRDGVWRSRTMQHLNLLLLPAVSASTTTTGQGAAIPSSILAVEATTTTNYKKKKTKNDDDESSLPLLRKDSPQRISNNDLYYDSIDSFHERIQQHVGDDGDNKARNTTISNDLQQGLDRLVEAGFADVNFARCFNKFEEYQAKDEALRIQILALQNGELQAWQKQRTKLTQQLNKAQRKYNHQQHHQQQKQESALLQAETNMDAAAAAAAAKSASSSSSSTATTPKEESNNNNNAQQSTAQTLLTVFKRLFPSITSTPSSSSSTEPQQQDETKRCKENNINERKMTKQASSLLLSKKKHDIMERKIQSLERSIAAGDSRIQGIMQRLEKLTKKKRALEQSAPMTQAAHGKASQVMESVMDIVCHDLARHMKERHAHILEQYRVLDAKTDLTKPHEWFPYARLDCRKIIFHGGPTNSGKTYEALERLKQASKGMYLGPLRLLAAEVYEQLTLAGIYCNLYTGQERREIPFATHGAATVEMASLVDYFDIVVIDEIQMIGDPERGFAWTRALLGSRCKEIHVCGGMEALGIVRRLAHACGDDFECREYQRFTDLKVAKKSLARSAHQKDSYRNVRPGDCVVAFSRNDIFAIKREIETTTKYKCTVIYGSLPPQTRSEQARLFNDPNSGYDILVASDAIGMGLNLNIRRIVFNSIFKHDGNGIVRLGHSAVKQISGRAGRRNSIYPNGEVTTRCPEDMEHLKKCMETEIDSVERAGLLPTANHIDAFSAALEHYGLGDGENNKLHKTLQRFSEMASIQSDFFLCRQTEMHGIARSITAFPLTMREKYTLCMCPVNLESPGSMDVLKRFASKLAAGEASGLTHSMVPRKPKSFDDLSKLCHIFSELDLFLWLQHKFPPGNIMEQQAALARKEITIGLVNEALEVAHTLKLNHCYVSRDQQLREKIRKNRRPRHGNRDDDSRNNNKVNKRNKGRGQEWNRGVPDI